MIMRKIQLAQEPHNLVVVILSISFSNDLVHSSWSLRKKKSYDLLKRHFA